MRTPGVLADAHRNPLHWLEPPGPHMIWNRRQQAACVRVPGMAQDLCGGALLDDPSRVHDCQPVREAGDHGEIVGHVEHRHALLPAQARELVQDARLGDHVQPGGRFVEHDYRRLADEGHRDADALLLSA